jgi:hypothetical protein
MIITTLVLCTFVHQLQTTVLQAQNNLSGSAGDFPRSAASLRNIVHSVLAVRTPAPLPALTQCEASSCILFLNRRMTQTRIPRFEVGSTFCCHSCTCDNIWLHISPVCYHWGVPCPWVVTVCIHPEFERLANTGRDHYCTMIPLNVSETFSGFGSLQNHHPGLVPASNMILTSLLALRTWV